MADCALITRPANASLALLDGRPVSVNTFLRLSRLLADTLPPGRHCINLCQDRFWFSVALAAAIRSGRTTLLPANRLPATIAELRACHPDSVLLSDAAEAEWPEALDSRRPIDHDPAPESVPRIAGDLLAAVVFTSGSTGRSSRVPKPWRTLAQSTLFNARWLGAEGDLQHLLATVPPQHMWGLETSVLLPWFAPVVVDHRQPFFPAAIVEALATLPPRRVLVSTPFHLRSLAAHLDGAPLPAERIWCATAPLDPQLARVLSSGGGTEMTEIYGCSEAGCLARRDPVCESDWQAFDAFELQARDGYTEVQAPHLPAPVRLHDQLVFAGEGRFRLLGRSQDLVNVAGKRTSLSEVTGQLLRLPGVLDAVVFMPPDAARGGHATRLAALVVAPGKTVRDLRQALREVLDAEFVPRPIRLVAALPRAASGKLARQAVLDLYAATQADADAAG